MSPGEITNGVMAMYFSTDDGTNFSLLACQNNASFSPSIDTIEVDCKDTGPGAKHLKGKFRWEMSGSCVLIFNTSFGYSELMAILKSADAKVTVKFTTDVEGDEYEQGKGTLTGLPLQSSGGSNGLVTFDYTILGDGVTTTMTVPAP